MRVVVITSKLFGQRYTLFYYLHTFTFADNRSDRYAAARLVYQESITRSNALEMLRVTEYVSDCAGIYTYQQISFARAILINNWACASMTPQRLTYENNVTILINYFRSGKWQRITTDTLNVCGTDCKTQIITHIIKSARSEGLQSVLWKTIMNLFFF